MSVIFENMKKNINPFQKIKDNTNLFINAFFEDDEYSDDFEPEEPTFSPIDNNEWNKPIQITFNYENKENNKDYEENKKKINLDECEYIQNNKDCQEITEFIDIELLINNLKTLIDLEVYQKIYVEYFTTKSELNFKIFVDNTYFQQITRWYYNQNRTNAVDAITKIINITLNQIKINENTNDILYNKLNILLQKAYIGLEKLKITYETDSEIVYKINKIINKTE